MKKNRVRIRPFRILSVVLGVVALVMLSRFPAKAVSLERQQQQLESAAQAYYDAQGENGFDMAMTLPGMVRVIQAAGRLIRTETDEGELLLIDQRFRSARIRALLRGTLIGDALGIE